MNKHYKHYKHPSGLIFEATRMMDSEEKSSYDITIVCLFLPSSASDPMIIVDWYCGEPNTEATKEAADKFCSTKTWPEIQNLLECQDLANNYP